MVGEDVGSALKDRYPKLRDPRPDLVDPQMQKAGRVAIVRGQETLRVGLLLDNPLGEDELERLYTAITPQVLQDWVRRAQMQVSDEVGIIIEPKLLVFASEDPKREPINAGTKTWWLSFADGARPRGEQFLGCVITAGAGFRDAVERARELGCNPGGEVQGCELPDNIRIASRWVDRLLSRQECDQVSAEFCRGPGERTWQAPAGNLAVGDGNGPLS